MHIREINPSKAQFRSCLLPTTTEFTLSGNSIIIKRPAFARFRARRRACPFYRLCPRYHFSSPVSHKTGLFGSVTLSAVTGGTCRSLIRTADSVRCSGAIFRLFCLIPLSLYRNVLCKAKCKPTLSVTAFVI